MMLKRSRFMGLMATGLLLTSALISDRTPAADVPIKITGTIQIPPCEVNEGKVIVVDFKNVSVTDVTNKNNLRKVVVPFRCSYFQGTAYVKLMGYQLGSHTNVLKTNVDYFGIALYQGEGTETKLLLGDGKHSGQESIGYPIQKGLSGKSKGTFTFTAIPFKESDKKLTAGAFTASANMSISYF
ncbi:TPA: fimbrial protein [Escherichia coli]|uniref:fimbrial protein n=1 Tax=Escherichia coli TaxID=562 RepID=UPI0010CCAD59|nr:fimbrial protein [Escherichia coli]GDA12203.1 fimbrial adapter PapF precursor [Escherichia coli]HAX5303094.1 fimbrial protein [Escherichia coli]